MKTPGEQREQEAANEKVRLLEELENQLANAMIVGRQKGTLTSSGFETLDEFKPAPSMDQWTAAARKDFRRAKNQED